MDWKGLYPARPEESRVEFADVGCGYGGLLVALAPLFPSTLMLGLEIRTKVSQYVQQRIEALRATAATKESSPAAEDNLVPHPLYDNIAVLRSNAMKFLPNLFEKAQLSKMFFLFPDPHFKRKKHKARIISPTLLSEYAYVLRPGGRLYTVTDVPDLHEWIKLHLDAHPLFKRLSDEELADDQAVPCILNGTEEGRKVDREGRSKFLAVYRRVDADDDGADADV